ncbi:MAG: hypothetical protein WCU88_09160 [Elusimicrobiota bacterium]|jgi:hypothetical protein
MRKIRGFRLAIHPKELRRRLRRAADLEAVGLAEDEAFEKHVVGFGRRLSPSVVFESFGAESKDTAELSPLPGLAHTLGALSLGAGADAFCQEEREAHEERGKLAAYLTRMALEEGVRFVIELIAEEVEDERCDLSPIHYLREPGQLAFALEKLCASKIGLSCEEEGRLRPEIAAVFCLSWIARPRGRKVSKSGASKKK